MNFYLLYYKMNTIFSEDIVCLIETFTGPNYWKLQFSATILPRINKGWRLVGIDPDDYTPCRNCYFYGNGIDVGCNNNPLLCTFTEPVWAKKEDVDTLEIWKMKFHITLWQLQLYQNTNGYLCYKE